MSGVIFSFFILFTNLSIAKDVLVKTPWFEHTNCNLLKIAQLKSISDQRITHSVIIEDPDVIKNLVDRISTIPADGDKMVSFGLNAEEIDLEFHCENKIQTIEIYGHRFKTPSTGFNSGKSEIEDGLYRDIDALLFPDFNKTILKVKNLILPFKNFSITYKGSEFKDYSPKTVSSSIDSFLITDRRKHERLVQIVSGQLPPRPQLIEINHKKFTLLTYETKSHVRLYPHYFQITNEDSYNIFKGIYQHFKK